MARAGDAVRCEKGAEHRGARGETGAQALGEHAVAHALRGTARLVERKPQGVVEACGAELEQPAGPEARGKHAEQHRRMPALAEAVVASEAEPRVQLGAHGVSEQELAP